MQINNISNLDNGDIIIFYKSYGCFNIRFKSKISKIGLILINPNYNNKLYKGVYVLEGTHNNNKIINTKITLINSLIEENNYNKIYIRKLYSFQQFPHNLLNNVIDSLNNNNSDTNIYDWSDSLIQKKLSQYNDSINGPLLAYIYIKLGYLNELTSWALITSYDWTKKDFDLKLKNCNIGPLEKLN